LDVASEAKLYDELMKEKITLISVAHRESLMKYHNLLLCVDSGGQWTLQKL
jgi:putative ATP-binding cassette transporter